MVSGYIIAFILRRKDRGPGQGKDNIVKIKFLHVFWMRFIEGLLNRITEKRDTKMCNTFAILCIASGGISEYIYQTKNLTMKERPKTWHYRNRHGFRGSRKDWRRSFWKPGQ